MALVTSPDFRRLVLSLLRPYLTQCQVNLFANDYVPVVGMQLNDLTPPTFVGYQPQALTVWSDVYLLASGNAQLVELPHVFTVLQSGGSDNVYGYYITDARGFLVLAERDPNGPQPMFEAGQQYSALPRLESGALF